MTEKSEILCRVQLVLQKDGILPYHILYHRISEEWDSEIPLFSFRKYLRELVEEKHVKIYTLYNDRIDFLVGGFQTTFYTLPGMAFYEGE